jgi:hypothetical protein
MADEALVSFRTDIGETVTQVRSGLREILAEESAFSAKFGNLNSAGLTRALGEIDTALERTGAELQKLAALDKKALGNSNYVTAATTQLRQLSTEIGRISGSNGLTIEVGVELRRQAISQLNSKLNADLKQLSNRAESGLTPLKAERLGNVTKGITTSRRDVERGFSIGQANPVDFKEAQRDADQLSAALDAAAGQAERAEDNLAVVNKATSNAARSAGEFASSMAKAAANAASLDQTVKDQQNKTGAKPAVPAAGGGRQRGGGNGDDGFRILNPPGDAGDGEGKKRSKYGEPVDLQAEEDAFAQAVDEAIFKITYGLDKTGATFAAKAAEVRRIAAIIEANYNSLGLALDGIDAKAIQEAFLRGDTPGRDGRPTIRTGDYAPGVNEFGPNNGRLSDTRFNENRPNEYTKTERGAERYIPDATAGRRSQEALGEDLARELTLALANDRRGTKDLVDQRGGTSVLKGQSGEYRAFNTRTGEALTGEQAVRSLDAFTNATRESTEKLNNLRLLTAGLTEEQARAGNRFNPDTTVAVGRNQVGFQDPITKNTRGFEIGRDKLPTEIFGEELDAFLAGFNRAVNKVNDVRDAEANRAFLRQGREPGGEFGPQVTTVTTTNGRAAVATDPQGVLRAYNAKTGENLNVEQTQDALNAFAGALLKTAKTADALKLLTDGRREGERFNDRTVEIPGNRAINSTGGTFSAFDVRKPNEPVQLQGEELQKAVVDYTEFFDKRAAEQRSLDDTERLRRGAGPDQRFNPAVVEVNKSLIAEFDASLTNATRYYKLDADGIATEIVTRDELVRAQRTLAQAQLAEAERSFKEGQERNKLNNRQDLIEGADPTKNGGFAEGVVPLTGGYVADLRNGVQDFYKKSGDGFVKLGEISAERQTALGKLLQKQAADLASDEATKNARRLYDANNKGTGLVENAKRYAGQDVTILEDGVRQFYKKVADGLRRVEPGTVEYEQESVKYNRGGGSGRGIGGGFVHGLTSGGFGGSRDEGFLEGIGTAAGTTLKYSALYGVLNILQGVLSQAGQEMVNFADSNTDLQIALENATGATQEANEADKEWLQTLEKISIQAGSNVGDVQDVVAAGIRTIGINAELSTEQVKVLGTEFARQAQIMAVLAKTDITDAAGNLRAIGNSFNIPLQSSARVNDAFVVGKNVGGGDEAETAQAVASAGESLKSAGFTIEQAFALASRIQAATDQTGAAVGNKLSRIVSIVSGTAGQKAILEANSQLPQDAKVDISAAPEEQLLALSKAYNAGQLGQGTIKSLTNSLGGTSSAKELITILEQYAQVAGEVAENTDIAGKANEEYEKRLEDLSQKVREFKGAFSAIVVNLTQSGLLDPLLAGFGALVEVLKFVAAAGAAVNTFVDGLGVIGEVAPGIVITTVAILALGKAIRGLETLGGGSLAKGITTAALKVEEQVRPRVAEARAENASRKTSAADGALAGAASTAGTTTTAATGASRAATAAGAQVATTVTRSATAAAAGAAAAGTGAAVASAATMKAAIATAAATAATTSAGTTAATATAAAATVRAQIAAAAAQAAAATAAAGAAGGAARLAEGRARPIVPAVEGAAAGAAGAAAKAGRLAGVGAAARTAGSVALGAAGGPIGLAITGGILGLTALAGLKSKSDELGAAMEDATTAADALSDLDISPESTSAEIVDAFKNQASALQAQIDQLDAASSGLTAGFVNIFTGKADDAKEQIKALQAQETYAEQQAKKFTEFSTDISSGLSELSVFGDPTSITVDSLNQGLSTLSEQAYSSADRVRLLSEFLGLIPGVKGSTPVSDADRTKIAATNTASLVTNAPDTIEATRTTKPQFFSSSPYLPGTINVPTAPYKAQVDNSQYKKFLQDNSSSLNSAYKDALPDVAEGANGAYSTEQIATIAKTVAAQAKADWTKVYNNLSPAQKALPELQPDAIAKQVQDGITAQLTPAKVDTTSAAAILAAITGLKTVYESQIATATTYAEKSKLMDQELAAIDAEIAKFTGDKSSAEYAGLLEARNSVAQSNLDSFISSGEDLRKAQQAKATTDAQVKQIGEAFFVEAVQKAYDLGDVDALIDLFNEANKAEVAMAESIVKGNLKAKKAAADAEKANNAAIDAARDAVAGAESDNPDTPAAPGAEPGTFGNGAGVYKNPDDPYAVDPDTEKKAKEKKSKDAQEEYDRAKKGADAFDEAKDRSTPADEGGSIETGEDADQPKTPFERRQKKAELAIAERNATSLADASLDQSDRAVKDAQQRVDAYVTKAQKNTPEYWAAVKELNDAKYKNAMDEIDAMDRIGLTQIDSTDPIAVAALQAATAKTKREEAEKQADKAGLKGRKRADYLSNFVNDERSKNASLQSTSESEYLSNLQTSLDLGRISHKKYLEMLKARRDQLYLEAKAIGRGNEGYAQTKKLADEAAKTYKDAVEGINDQFNLGDIKVPTVYQVRKSLKEQTTGQVLGNNGAMSAAGNVTNDNSTRNVILNGVPVETILTMIQDLFGVKARSTAKRRIGA